MEDEVVWVCVETREDITDEQAKAAGELGWQKVPGMAEDSLTRFLARPVGSKEEAIRVVEHLDELETTPMVALGLIYQPPNVEGPLKVPARVWGPAPQPADDAQPEEPEEPGGATEQPKKEDQQKQQPNAFPAIPEYIWKTLKPQIREDLAKDMVDYVINRPDSAAYGDRFDDAALFAHLAEGDRPTLAKQILELKHGMTTEQLWAERLVNLFQYERINLMQQAVATARETNLHLERWRDLSKDVSKTLEVSSKIAVVFVLLLFGLVFIGRISGWEMAVLVFVFALMAVSPSTLLLIGRPLKGLDEWSPSKQEKKAEEAAKEEPAKDKGKPEAEAAK